jgi:hypothetical protein
VERFFGKQQRIGGNVDGEERENKEMIIPPLIRAIAVPPRLWVVGLFPATGLPAVFAGNFCLIGKTSWRAGRNAVKSLGLAVVLLALISALPGNSWAKGGKCLAGNCENGQGTFEYADGMKYVGDWRNGKEHGQGRMTLPGGSIYEGAYKDGLPNGHGVYDVSNGKRYDGEWQDGMAEGRGFESDPDGSSYEGHWHLGLPNGYGVSTVGGGVDKQGYWVDGEFVGMDRPWNVQ